LQHNPTTQELDIMTARQYLTARYAVLTTDLGRFLMWSNGQRTLDDGRVVDTVGFRTEQAHNLPVYGDPAGITADEVDPFVTVNRVDWRYHSFARLDATTGDIVSYSDPAFTDASRIDWKDAPYESRRKAETKIEAAIRPALETFAKSDEGRAWLSHGRYFAANNDAHRAERELAEAKAKVAEVEANLAAAVDIMLANPIES
jgi:hypothetical protein